MASIKISDLQPTGFDLLLDSDELMDNVVGGTSVNDRLIWRYFIEEGEGNLRL